jgi:hypothetical protein
MTMIRTTKTSTPATLPTGLANYVSISKQVQSREEEDKDYVDAIPTLFPYCRWDVVFDREKTRNDNSKI